MAVLVASGTAAVGAGPGDDSSVELAAMLSMTGDEKLFGSTALGGIELAIAEAQARGGGPPIVLKIYDEESSVETARRVAAQVVASRAPLVLGSALSYLSLVEGPTLADGGIAALAIATSDLITRNPTTFRINFKNSEEGELLAVYLSRVLGQHRVAAIYIDDGYGSTLRQGFESGAKRLGLDVTYLPFKTTAEARDAAASVVADPTGPAVALLMLDAPATTILPILRRGGVTTPIVSAQALGDDAFTARMADEPEERQRHGALTDDLYATSPMILDSAYAEMLAFADRFRARFGHDPSYEAAAGYDAAKLAIGALRAVARPGQADVAAMRAGILAYLRGLNSPAQALPGLLGPIWLDQYHGRAVAIRIGRFSAGHFASAPLQIVPVSTPSASELASGAVFEMAPGHYGRLQRVVYTGLYLNEISHIDVARSSFGADFYLWLRSAADAGADSIDPADIIFPNMMSGTFNPARPAEQGEMPDGTLYRLWRVQGEFRNDFDLHDFPFDRQRLELPFYNARGASDRIVYVLDRRTSAAPAEPQRSAIASPAAFSDLTQWEPLGGTERRENLVTGSSLGDPRRMGTTSYRELSGFIATFDVRRLALSTVAKNLMPLLLMTLIIYTTLHFPAVLIKEKVTVAVTGALSGAVLLTAINSQLGSIGYTIAIEYAFFVFFGLTTFSIVAALAAHHFRHLKRDHMAIATERGTRAIFILAIAGLLAGAGWLATAGAPR